MLLPLIEQRSAHLLKGPRHHSLERLRARNFRLCFEVPLVRDSSCSTCVQSRLSKLGWHCTWVAHKCDNQWDARHTRDMRKGCVMFFFKKSCIQCYTMSSQCDERVFAFQETPCRKFEVLCASRCKASKCATYHRLSGCRFRSLNFSRNSDQSAK